MSNRLNRKGARRHLNALGAQGKSAKAQGMRQMYWTLLCSAMCGLAPAAWAQDGGALLKQLELEQKQRAVPSSSPALVPSAPAVSTSKAAEAGARVQIKALVFKGNTLITQEELSAALHDVMAQSLSFDQLQALTTRVEAIYSARGWLARVSLPEQDITEGTLQFKVLEARLGQYRLQGDARLARAEDILARVTKRLPPGSVLSTQQLERSLAILDEWPGVQVSGQLATGAQEGTTDMVLSLKDEPEFQGRVMADNYGSDSTGKGRLGVLSYWNSPDRRGDQLAMFLQTTEGSGSDYGRLSYEFPVGSTDWRLGLNYSRLDYDVTRGISGESVVSGIQASYPGVRSPQLRTDWNLSHEEKKLTNEENPASVKVSTISWQRTQYEQSSVSNLVLSYLNGYAKQQTDYDQSGGTFHVFSAKAAINHMMDAQWTFSGKLQIQLASQNLTSTERLTLGGPSGVRAHTTEDGSGSLGGLLNLELRRRLTPQWSAVGFVDAGYARNKNNSAAPSRLKGAGIGLSYQQSALSVDWVWAQAINDQQKNRAWVSVQYSF